MDIYVHITLDESPALMKSLDCLCECLRDVINPAGVTVAETPKETATAAPAKTPAPAPAKKEAAKPAADLDKLTEDEIMKIRKLVPAFLHKSPDNKQKLKTWLEENHVKACKVTNVTRPLLPAILELLGGE
ncbi:hypothetical protein [Megasphaera sp.]|uniref:hypothetical protein n=1 Tax=Megasphaera sp. TaxID=2023260 RepID=UPI00402A1D50